MKAIFYTSTLSECNLTATDKIVYSQMLYRSLWDDNETSFSNEGELILDTYETEYEGYVPIGWSVNETLAPELNITTRQYYISRKKLRDMGYMTEYGIRLLPDTLNHFFELKTDTGLSGYRLIVYSYIAHKNAEYGWMDKYHSVMATELHMDRGNLEHILTDLREQGRIAVKYRGRQAMLRAV